MRKILISAQLLSILAFAAIFYTDTIPKIVSIPLFVGIMTAITLFSHSKTASSERRLQTKISDLSKELNVASTRITSVSQEIGITVAENNASSKELFEKTKEMSSLTADVNTSLQDTIVHIKEMLGLADETHTSAMTMEDISHKSFATIQSGMSEILHIVDNMKAIKETSSTADARIEKLKSTSEDILTIVNKISEISQKMHIIAINASVESARAGKSGNSFAVVAKEFQMLASITDRSVGDISELVDTIQQDINDVYQVSKENASRVDNGVRNSTVIDENLKLIEQSFRDVVKMVGRLGTISETESKLADEMNHRVAHIESLMTRTGIHVSQVYDVARSQNRGIENISKMSQTLNVASSELFDLAENSSSEKGESLDVYAKTICEEFFSVMEKELCKNPAILGKDAALHHTMLHQFQANHEIVEAVWTNEPNGRFICSIPSAGFVNASMREWFRSAMQGENYISKIYISGITKNRCVTLSMPYRSGNGEILGVIGVDLNLMLMKA